MKKKMMMMFLSLLVSAASYAQFEQGKLYANASLSGLDLSYNSLKKWNLGINAKFGCFFADDWMVLVDGSWNIRDDAPNDYRIGAGFRYHIEQNGLYLGAGACYKHEIDHNDFMPNINIGYTYFLSRTVTIEPEIYYDFSLKNFKDYSDFGFRLGLGVYLDELF